MANDDSTRPGFDLSPWLGKDPLSIFQAAWLWAGIPPTLPTSQENKARYGRELAAARGWFDCLNDAAKSGRLAIQGSPPTKRVQTQGAVSGSSYMGTAHLSRPAEYREVEADDWRAACVALADLRAYAESIGQRPAFLFAGTGGAATPGPPEQPGAAGSNTNIPSEKWTRGIRRIAWDAAKSITENGYKLTADGLEKAMLNSDKVEFKNDEFQLKSTGGDLNDREMKAKPKTITGWVTELKKRLK